MPLLMVKNFVFFLDITFGLVESGAAPRLPTTAVQIDYQYATSNSRAALKSVRVTINIKGSSADDSNPSFS
jgi:hypothetical protein